MSELRIVLTTIGDSTAAKKLARKLVQEGLAACVNIVPGLLSIYEWEDKIEEESECLLMIKTVTGQVRQLQDVLQQLHPYELPEFVVLEAADASREYLGWVIGQTS
jgi:periplasmic divalent cation tolerance protein